MLSSRSIYEGIFDFLDNLRDNDYRISPHTYIAVQNLLVGLVARGALPDNPYRWHTWLAPIICSSPEEQSEFYDLFRKWLSAQETPSIKPPPITTAKKVLSFARRHRFTLIAILLVSLGIIFFFLSKQPIRPDNSKISGLILDDRTAAALANATISSLGQRTTSDSTGHFTLNNNSGARFAEVVVELPGYQTSTLTIDTSDTDIQIRLVKPSPSPSPSTGANDATTETIVPPLPKYSRFDLLLAYVLAGPLLVAGLILLWTSFRRRIQLEKLRSSKLLSVERTELEELPEGLFQGPAFRRTLQELRRYRQFQSTDLNVPATVNATAAQGGLFTPVTGSRKSQPEYLVLIDRATRFDQQAQFELEIAKRLEGADISVDLYFFRQDPRFCRNQSATARATTIHDMAARHPSHYLMIFSDGAGLVEPLTGEPRPWLDLFSSWTHRTLLTPESPNNWSYREYAIRKLGFTVVHATSRGIERFLETLALGAAHEAPSKSWYSARFPEVLGERPLRWLDDLSPDRTTVDRLCFELRGFLGDEGYHWLSACAVYPELQWALTLYFGQQLGITGQASFEERLLGMVRLPWFRHGTMPDWLRSRLISTLPNERENLIRRSIDNLPITSVRPYDSTLYLSFVKPPSEVERSRSWKNALLRLVDRWWPWRRKRGPSKATQGSDDRDYVFLSFMFGFKPSRLAVAAPAKLRSLLFRQGKATLELRPVAGTILTFFLALVVSSLGFLTLIYPNSRVTNIGANPLINSPWWPIPGPTLTETPSYEITFRPNKGEPGKEYPFAVKISDCSHFSLADSSLTAPGGSGIGVGGIKSGPCNLSSTLRIATKAQPAIVPLTLVTKGLPNSVLNFRILSSTTPEPETVAPEVSCVGIQDISQCPSEGCSSIGVTTLAELNKVKNRTNAPTNPRARSLNWIRSLPDPTSWQPGADRAELKALGEGVPVTVLAFVQSVRRGAAESCNCGLRDARFTDVTLVLTDNADDQEMTSVTAEVTPRIRLGGHPEFVFSQLKPLEGGLVRITGWLMFDDQHFTDHQLRRATNWEIHPITQIEVCTGSVEGCREGVGWKTLKDYVSQP